MNDEKHTELVHVSFWWFGTFALAAANSYGWSMVITKIFN